MLWGLLSALTGAGLSVQAFGSRASFVPHDAARNVTGRPRRYLDSWLMSEEQSHTAFSHGMASCELALVEGAYNVALPGGAESNPAGSLDCLADRLSLPRLAAIDLSLVDRCLLPCRPDHVEGVLLDRAESRRHALYWQTNFEALWGVPVLGWLQESRPIQALLDYLPAGQPPSRDLCSALGLSLRPELRLDLLLDIAERGGVLPAVASDAAASCVPRRRTIVALALDEAFTNYFPETLEHLETAGVVLRDFSPLRGESIPEGADVVYLGGGSCDRYWPQLAENHCLAQSLRCFAARGGRIYAEGSGLAYLCRQVVLADGRRETMVGVLPAIARQHFRRPVYEPVEITFGASSWLFDCQAQIRGYRDRSWEIEPAGPMLTFAQGPQHRMDVVGRGNVIGSRLPLYFSTQRPLLRRLGSPTSPHRQAHVVMERKS